MQMIRINDRLSVSVQPELPAFATLATDGLTAVINLRPDGEDPTQPGNAAEQAAALAAGLSYRFVPISGVAGITNADIDAFQAAVGASKGQVLAHCKSGARALMLHVMGEVRDGRMPRDQAEAFGALHGFDLSAAGRWLDAETARVPKVKAFFDPRTSSVQYIVTDPATKHCVIIDPVLDFDEKSGATGTMNADAILAYVAQEGLTIDWILDTHPHADHFSAAHYLKGKTGAPTATGAQVIDVQALWKGVYNSRELATDGSQWDRLLSDGETFQIGSIDGHVLHSPGHTLSSVTYVIGDAAFIHDTMFMPDGGTARADFPGGSATILWNSIQAILALPDETRLFTGHDYQPGGRHPRWESTVGEQRRKNIHISSTDGTGFVAQREGRDRTLSMPKLLLHALQVNMRAGRLPEPEEDGRRYLKFPLDALEGATW